MTQDTTATQPALTPATRKPSAAELYAAAKAEMEAKLAALAAEVEAEAQAAEEARAADVAKIDASLAELDAAVAGLLAKKAALQARREELEPTAQQTTTPRSAGDQPWKRSPSYQFWKHYQRAYKTPQHTQRTLTATCKQHNIDQSDTSVDNLARAHAILS